ncbi:MAG: xanthan lyase [Muribaculaceae bacterium]|nr:xanthan lyase [Muribaculaceae bacterium]
MSTSLTRAILSFLIAVITISGTDAKTTKRRAPKAGALETALTEAFRNWVPPYTKVAGISVKSAQVNPSAKTVTLVCNDRAGYLPYTEEDLESLYAALAEALPESQRDYEIKIRVVNTPIERLLRGAPKNNPGPSETRPFVRRLDESNYDKGMAGANIALWPSHGRYFEKRTDRWQWQRGKIMQTVEDIYTPGYVYPFLIPMLENAGAYVLCPRERDTSSVEIIVDRDGGCAYSEGYSESEGKYKWHDGTGAGFGQPKPVLRDGENPFRAGGYRSVTTVDRRNESSAVEYSADIPERGTYAVYVSYGKAERPAHEAPYTVHDMGGDRHFTVNQAMGAGTWIYLGDFEFDKGKQKIVTLTNICPGANATLTADAVKIGGGMGNIERSTGKARGNEPTTSGYPRFCEGARYFMQWSGIPDSIYSVSDHTSDYADDYKGRGPWVNYLSGGSSMNPGWKGLGIPIDFSMGWHTDAGLTYDDSTIGTLAIYSTDGGKSGGGGRSRLAGRDLADYVVTMIVNDIRATTDSTWTRRSMFDKNYAEARTSRVPAFLLELLSHQNFPDMRLGLDPSFRFTVARAVYKGMLWYLAERDNRAYMIQPLPVSHFAIGHDKENKGAYLLTWQPTEDQLEPTAEPEWYDVEMRTGNGAFKKVARVDTPRYLFRGARPGMVYSFRITAGNSGGKSFPSEVLAVGTPKQTKGSEVTIVNGFTRVSGPDWFDTGEQAGFNDEKDHGVPYMKDISFSGSQYDFDRLSNWVNDDNGGFGASADNYETTVIAGNTQDYVAKHGAAILAAGYPFVSESLEAFTSPLRDHRDGGIVDLILGKQKTIEIIPGKRKYGTFPTELQEALRRHTAAGGRVIASGSYIVGDMWDNAHNEVISAESGKKFANEVLGVTWDPAGRQTTGKAQTAKNKLLKDGPVNVTFATEINPDFYAVENVDALSPANASKATVLMTYPETGKNAGIVHQGKGYRAVTLGFPFETIQDTKARQELMELILKSLD